MTDQINYEEIDALATFEIYKEEPIHQIPVEASTVEALSLDEKLAKFTALSANGYNE